MLSNEETKKVDQLTNENASVILLYNRNLEKLHPFFAQNFKPCKTSFKL
jgi:hypothetical protein